METGIIKKVKTTGSSPILVHDLVFVEKGIMKITIDCLAIAEDGSGGFSATGHFIYLKSGKGDVYEGDQIGHNQVVIEYMGNGLTSALFNVEVINDRIFIKAIGEEGKRLFYKFNICPKYLQL